MQEIRRSQQAAGAHGKKDDGDEGGGGDAAPAIGPAAAGYGSSPAAGASTEMDQRSAPSVTDPRTAPPLHYRIRLSMMSDELQRTFVQSTLDDETAAFLRAAKVRRYVTGFFSDLLYATCLSRTSANAVTFRGGMFVLSRENAERLLAGAQEAVAGDGSDSAALGGNGGSRQAPFFERWCDIGAGDGGVTSKLAHMCGKIIATEASWPMQWRLMGRGYSVTGDIEAGAPYDAVSLFNVLDRCDKPQSLLRDMRRWVKPNGTVVMAVVLPWCPFVEDGNKQKRPSEELPMTGARCGERVPFEQCVQTLVDNVIRPTGFEVLRWTRVPYLCEGSAFHQYYALDDVVLVMRPAEPGMSAAAIKSVADELIGPVATSSSPPA